MEFWSTCCPALPTPPLHFIGCNARMAGSGAGNRVDRRSGREDKVKIEIVTVSRDAALAA